jgi:hypothetical protein
VKNKEFLQALKDHGIAVRRAKRHKQEPPQVSEYLGTCIVKIAEHLAFKPNFSGYTFKDEMISDAIENCLIYINNFDPKKGNNPFAYYTQIAWYAFVRRINREQKQLMTKYKFIESLDLNSSLLSSTQRHDESEYGNSHIDYLKNEVDLAYLELSKEEKAVKPKSRKPLYMNKPRVQKKKKRKTLTKRA